MIRLQARKSIIRNEFVIHHPKGVSALSVLKTPSLASAAAAVGGLSKLSLTAKSSQLPISQLQYLLRNTLLWHVRSI